MANNVKLAIPDKVVAGSVHAELRVIGKILEMYLVAIFLRISLIVTKQLSEYN